MTLRTARITVAWEAYSPTVDVDGAEVDGWAAPVDVMAYAFNPGTSETLREVDPIHRDVTQPTLYLPLGTVVAARGRVTVDGVRFLVDGSPRAWSHPSTNVSGVVASLRRVDG